MTDCHAAALNQSRQPGPTTVPWRPRGGWELVGGL
jgi:hypothetical protein